MGAVDADAHVVECEHTFDFLDPEFADLKPRVMMPKPSDRTELDNEGYAQSEYWVIDGRLQPKESNIGHNTTRESREMENVAARLEHMDELGVDVQVLYPTLFLRPVTTDPRTEFAYCQSYNRWLADIWKSAPDRLRWVMMPPLLSMDRVADELKIAKENGACGVFMRGLECDRRLDDPYFFPLYQAASDLDLAICLHSGNNSFNLNSIYGSESGFARAKLPVVSAFHTLLMKDIPARFPKLRWGFVEVSSQWIPYVLNDAGLRLLRRGKRLSRSPLADRNFYVAVQVTDDLDRIVPLAGENHLMVGTDYGHADTSSEIEALRLLKENGKVAPAVADRILDGNARTLYGL